MTLTLTSLPPVTCLSGEYRLHVKWLAVPFLFKTNTSSQNKPHSFQYFSVLLHKICIEQRKSKTKPINWCSYMTIVSAYCSIYSIALNNPISFARSPKKTPQHHLQESEWRKYKKKEDKNYAKQFYRLMCKVLLSHVLQRWTYPFTALKARGKEKIFYKYEYVRVDAYWSQTLFFTYQFRTEHVHVVDADAVTAFYVSSALLCYPDIFMFIIF